MARTTCLLALLGMAMLATAQKCTREKGTTPMFEWLPTEAAPDRFPVHLIRGDLFFADGNSVYVPDGRDVANGWGMRGSTHIVGEVEKPVPVRLELEWFSYTEDRFYQGAFALPAEEMTALFSAGVTDPLTGRLLGFERIIVGMAPEGTVSVWMAAGAEVVEVASFLAPEVSLPWERVLKNPEVSREAFVRQVLEAKLGPEGLARLAREGVPKGLYQGYRKRYLWRPLVKGPGTPTGLWVRSFNGENSFIGPAGPAVARASRPVPAEMQLDWIAPGSAALTAKVTFDEAEIFAAFAKLSRGEASHQLVLEIQVSRSGAAVSLRDETYILPLEKVRVDLFRGN